MKLSAVILALSLAACAPLQNTPPVSTPGARLSVERVSGGGMRLILDNGASDPIGYNLCSSVLQRRNGTAWTDIATGEVCTMQLMTLNPGFDATFEKRLPENLADGEYRYVTSIENPLGAGSARVATDPFILP
jgi:hypothetical protein